MTHPAFPRSGGVLMPLASLNGRFGIGDLGPAAHEFARWCGRAGLTWWQLLPTGPIGPGDSPYSSNSAFAAEPLLISLEQLAREGLLAEGDLEAPTEASVGMVDYPAVREFKQPRLRRAFERWSAKAAASDTAFDEFCASQAGWLDDFAERSDDPLYTRFLQHSFDVQWRALRDTARETSLRLMGDLPIFVDLDSVDVAARPELFRVDSAGKPEVITGVPPDDFTPDGQCWGHPHYKWAAHRVEDFAWWRARVGRILQCFDAVRIDHFIGFHHAYEIPAENDHARIGEWCATPGGEVLAALQTDHPTMPLVAEDLGNSTHGVRELRDAFGLPGMSILQWAFSPNSPHAPHRIPENSVVYPATHDMDTCRGWLRTQDEETQRRILAYTGGSAPRIAWDLWRCACTSGAHTAIVQAQDLLGLGSRDRTNTPGSTSGNWRWRPRSSVFTSDLASRIHDLLEATDRLPAR